MTYTRVRRRALDRAPLVSSKIPQVYYQGGLEITRDEVHPDWRGAGSRKRDLGGPLESLKYTVSGVERFSLRARYPDGTTRYWTDGGIAASGTARDACYLVTDLEKVGNPPVAKLSNHELNALGATAVSRTIPTSPTVSVAQTLGELKEGLPSMIGKSARKGDLGGEYLNFQFGISPIISDVQAYAEAYRKSDEIIAQWLRDSGRRVRRRYRFPKEVTVSENVYTKRYPQSVGALGTNSYLMETGTLTIHRKMEREVWFSGAYRYFVPHYVRAWQRELATFNRLYGLYPNPQTAWELMPWSWFVDYGTNVGDVIKNISSLGRDDLVLSYGYLMAHTRVEETHTWKGRLRIDNAWTTCTLRNVITSDAKQRVRANPFGFGLEMDGLTPRQIAILAALGISRKG